VDTKEQVQRPRMCCSVFNLQKLPLGSGNMVAKKEEKKRKKRKEKR
jgi:hypothetical protein